MDPTIECHPSDEQKEEEDPLAMQCATLEMVGGLVGGVLASTPAAFCTDSGAFQGS
jgi:hypothetical protein